MCAAPGLAEAFSLCNEWPPSGDKTYLWIFLDRVRHETLLTIRPVPRARISRPGDKCRLSPTTAATTSDKNLSLPSIGSHFLCHQSRDAITGNKEMGRHSGLRGGRSKKKKRRVSIYCLRLLLIRTISFRRVGRITSTSLLWHTKLNKTLLVTYLKEKVTSGLCKTGTNKFFAR